MRFAAVVAELAAPPRPVVLVDGRSGAGKSTLAARLVAAWPGPVTLVSLDDLVPGWDGLAAGSDAVARDVLRRTEPGYTRWDWHRRRPGGWVDLASDGPLVVEGCGALTPANRALATAGIWVELPDAARRERALARDGATFAPHWDRWAAQEDTHLAAHHPTALADWWYRPGHGFARR